MTQTLQLFSTQPHCFDFSYLACVVLTEDIYFWTLNRQSGLSNNYIQMRFSLFGLRSGL
eukprot:UN03407